MAPPARKGHDWVVNAVGRRVPTHLDGRTWRPFAGAFATPGSGRRFAARVRPGTTGRSKVVPSIKAALELFGARDGWTLGFHHHLRNGEGVILPTLDAAVDMGLRDLRLAQVALFPTHERVIDLIRALFFHEITDVFDHRAERGVFDHVQLFRRCLRGPLIVKYGWMHFP